MQLSSHFSLAEMTVSQTAARRGIDNTPPPEVVENLRRTCEGLEAVRVRLGGAPVHVTSGYRCPALNQLIGGARRSQHLTGEAADIIVPRFGPPAAVMAALVGSGIAYDQCILEFASAAGGGWIHVSFTREPRRQALVIDQAGTRAWQPATAQA